MPKPAVQQLLLPPPPLLLPLPLQLLLLLLLLLVTHVKTIAFHHALIKKIIPENNCIKDQLSEIELFNQRSKG